MFLALRWSLSFAYGLLIVNHAPQAFWLLFGWFMVYSATRSFEASAHRRGEEA